MLTYNKEEEQSTPSFDVLAKTIEYANCKDFDTVMSYYSDDYVFRGPIIGPITAADVRKTQEVILVLLFYLDILSVPLGIFEWLISSLPCYRERCHATKHSF